MAPGIVYTDAWKANAERAVQHMPEYAGMDARAWFEGIARGDYPEVFDRTPLRREQTVEDIGNAVVFLVSDLAVNVTLGLPFIRTSPDHGTAFSIAGKGKANPRSLIEALRLAHRMFENAGTVDYDA